MNNPICKVINKEGKIISFDGNLYMHLEIIYKDHYGDNNYKEYLKDLFKKGYTSTCEEFLKLGYIRILEKTNFSKNNIIIDIYELNYTIYKRIYSYLKNNIFEDIMVGNKNGKYIDLPYDRFMKLDYEKIEEYLNN